MYSYRSYSIRELFAGKARRVCAKGECDDDEKNLKKFWQNNFWLGRISRRFVSAKEMIAPHTTTTGEIERFFCYL